MNILIDLVPDKVMIGGREYDINSDFRTSILFELLMLDVKLTDAEKGPLALELYFSEQEIDPADREEAIECISWFYSCGRDNEPGEGSGSSGGTSMTYCFNYDSGYIFSAFLDQYGIDLQDEDMHWWKFRALFRGLKDDTMISKIMGYRSMTIDKNMSDAEKKHYRKLKRIYAIPDPRTDDEKERDFNNSLSIAF